jgi:hypothetical protein
MQFPSRYALLLAAPLSLWTVGCSSTLHLSRSKAGSEPQQAHQRLIAMGQVYQQKGNLEGAQRAFCQVLQEDPSNTVAREHVEDVVAAMERAKGGAATGSTDTLLARRSEKRNRRISDAELEDRVPKRRAARIEMADVETVPARVELATITPPTPAPAPTQQSIAADEELLEIDESLPIVNAGRPRTIVVEQPIEIAEVAPAPAGDSGWTHTSLVRLCPDASPDVLTCVAQLESADVTVRKEGLEALADCGESAKPACPAIQACLVDVDRTVQAYAAWAYWEITSDHAAVLPALRSIVCEGDVDAIAFACYALGQIGSPANSAIDCLAPLQNHESTLVQIHAAEALLKIADGDSGSVIVLSNALLSAEAEERCLAAVALGSAKGLDRDAAIGALIGALGDASPSVQQAAALSLGGYGVYAAKAEDSLKLAAASDDAETRNAVETALACIRK